MTVDNSDLEAADVPGDKLYAEIQQAVDAASPGDQIKVEAGTYEPFEVDKDNLTIREANANSNPVIDASGSGEEFAVLISADNVTVRGLEARNASEGPDPTGFAVTGSNNTLIGNVATDNVLGFAIGFPDLPANGNRVIGNTATENVIGFFPFEGSDNQFTKNSASQNSDFGFLDVSSTGNTYVGNSADENGEVGFFAYETEGTRLIANRADGNGLDGFQVIFSFGLTFIGNRATDNANDGFRLIGIQDSTLTGNSAIGNSGNGFSIDNPPLAASSGNVFTGNKARDNDGYGVYVDPESVDNLFRGMKCKGNGLGGSNIEGIC